MENPSTFQQYDTLNIYLKESKHTCNHLSHAMLAQITRLLEGKEEGFSVDLNVILL
jgi:hypothetical protein